MSLFFIQSSTLTSIANAIRSVTGTSGPIAVSAFASAVQNMSAGGGGGGTISGADYLNVTISDNQHDIYFYPPLETVPNLYYANMYIKSATFYSVQEITSDVFYGYFQEYIETVNAFNCTTIEEYAFENCQYLSNISFPLCESIGYAAFESCPELTIASFPVCTSIGSSAFENCTSLITASFPACTSIGSNAFYSCSALTTASFPMCSYVESAAFYGCEHLETAFFPAEAEFIGDPFGSIISFDGNPFTLYLSGSYCGSAESSIFGDYMSLPKIQGAGEIDQNAAMSSSSAAASGPIYNLSIYVPASLVAEFQESWGGGHFSENIFAWPT